MPRQLRESYNRNARISGIRNTFESLNHKWGKELSIIKEALKNNVTDEKLANTAILLENTANYLESANRRNAMMSGMRLNETTQPLELAAY